MKPVLLFGPAGASDEIEALTKAQVKGYTRKDGTYVKPHETSRAAAKDRPVGANAHKLINPGFAKLMHPGQRALSGFKDKKASPAESRRDVREHQTAQKKPASSKNGASRDYDHPHVVGRPSKLTNYQWTKETGSRPIAHTGKPTEAHEITFAGRNYMGTGKTGTSAHDGTPVRAFDEGEDGHRVWLDDQGRVHADSIDEVKNLRKRHEDSRQVAADDYVKPGHVKTKADEIDHLSKIAPENRTAGEKARLKKIINQGGLGKHSPEYQAHLKSKR